MITAVKPNMDYCLAFLNQLLESDLTDRQKASISMSNIETLLENENFNTVDSILSTISYEKMPNILIYAVLMTTVRFEK